MRARRSWADARSGSRPCLAARWLAASLAALAAFGLAGGRPDASAGRDLYIRYFDTSETTYTEIVVQDKRLRVRYFEDVIGRCARWIEQRPCWTEADLRLVESELAPAQRDDLIRLVEQDGILDLGPSYGGAANDQRFYPIEIAVRLGDEERRIVYQAFPGAASMPDSFARLRARLEGLARTAIGRKPAP